MTVVLVIAGYLFIGCVIAVILYNGKNDLADANGFVLTIVYWPTTLIFLATVYLMLGAVFLIVRIIEGPATVRSEQISSSDKKERG